MSSLICLLNSSFLLSRFVSIEAADFTVVDVADIEGYCSASIDLALGSNVVKYACTTS